MSTPRSDRSPWNWLLLVPIVVPLLTPLYNFDSPRLFGFPAFYWIQFSFILLGVATTSAVYQMTRRPADAVPVPVSPGPSTSPVPSAAPVPPASETASA